MSDLRIGFACMWSHDESMTWSGTPWHLRSALQRQVHVLDLGHHFGPEQHLLRAATARRTSGGNRSMWKYSRATRMLAGAGINRKVRSGAVDAVVMIQDIAPLDVPYYVYQDLSFDLLIRHIEAGNEGARLQFEGLDTSMLRRLRERQHDVYRRSAKVVAMSQWLADSLINDTGLPPEQVAVVAPGCNVPLIDVSDDVAPGPLSVLFVGREFDRKGGDLLVDAVALLRSRGHDVRVTIIGPPSWPRSTRQVDGVRYLGEVPYRVVADEMARHHLFALPSVFEPFGLAYAEAMACGLPIVGPNQFAVPEIVDHPDDGRLIDLNVEELADAILDIGSREMDGGRRTARAERARTRFNWDRSAGEFVNFFEAKEDRS